MSEEPYATPDLASIDLAKSFQPAWAQESGSSSTIAKFADRAEREDRGERKGGRREVRGSRGDRRPEKRPGRRDDRRDNRRPEREPQQPAPIAGWEIQFLPDKHGVDGLAKQIKTTAKAYPLFDLARLVLDKSPRYHVEFRRTSETATPLHQLKSDGTLWLTEREAVTRALGAELDKFYRRERVAVDPPKGVFPCVAVCGMSGVLIGPPNYHDYQSKLVRLHAERFANMPFEAFRNRIRMERDEELIAKWREEQSTREVYYPIDPSKPVAAPEPAPATEPAAEAAPDAPAPATTAEVAPEPEVALPAEPAAAAEEAVASEPPPEASEEPAPGESAPVRLEDLAAVEQHFREHHLAKSVVRIRDRVVVPGSAALNHSAPAVLRLTRAMWDELNRFPLPLAHRLAQHLSSRGVQIFKSHDITHAGVARPHFLDTSATTVSEAVSGMLKSIEENASAPRSAQWKALVALRPAPAEGEEDHREAAVAADLLWLLHQGHVIDFAKRGLQVARRPSPPPPRKPSKTKSPDAAPAPATDGEAPAVEPEPVTAPTPAEPESTV